MIACLHARDARARHPDARTHTVMKARTRVRTHARALEIYATHATCAHTQRSEHAHPSLAHSLARLNACTHGSMHARTHTCTHVHMHITNVRPTSKHVHPLIRALERMDARQHARSLARAYACMDRCVRVLFEHYPGLLHKALFLEFSVRKKKSSAVQNAVYRLSA